MRKALIFCDHRVPTAEPNAIRLINIALILKKLGYETVLYGVDNNKEISGEERGVCFVQWSQTSGCGIIPRRIRKKEYYMHAKSVLDCTDDVSVIITAIGIANAKTYHYLRDYAHGHGIAFIQSIVEWYGLSHIGGWKRLHRYLYNEYLMRVDYAKAKKIISISSYIAEYYKKKGVRTIVIPTIVDMREYEDATHARTERITFVYAGSPRRKDCIINAIYALEKLSTEERNRIQFHLFGASEKDLLAVGLTSDVINNLGDSFVVHGAIPYADVKQQIANADYTILLRHNTVNANAGFSTKVGESMACGTPVIANLTSDMGKYLQDGKTGIVCKNETVAECLDAYRKALAMETERYYYMRDSCKQTANIGFNYETYIDEVKWLIEVK